MNTTPTNTGAVGTEIQDFETATASKRRTILKTAVWSVPIIATAIAVPAHAASRCTPVPNNVTQTFTNVTRPSGPWTNPTSTSFGGRVDLAASTANVTSTVTFTNSAPVAIPAGTLSVRVALWSNPGLATPGTSTPSSALGLPSPLPTGWILDSSYIAQGTASNGSVEIRQYNHVLRYTLALPAGAAAPSLALTAVATVPRPSATSYGSNLSQAPLPATSDYGSNFFATASIATCSAVNGAPTTVTNTAVASQLWGVYIVRPSATARTGEQASVAIEPVN